jgi:hypothetical protein
MSPSFWIALVIGLVSAIPILKWPDDEWLWGSVGALANAIQSGTFHAGLTFPDKYRMSRQCTFEGPAIPGIGKEVCREVPVYAGPGGPQFNFGEIFRGMFEDFAGAITACVLLILIGLVFMDKKTRDAKRRKIFRFLAGPAK